MFYRNKFFQRYFDTLRSHFRMVRALQRADGDPKSFIHIISCDSLLTGLCQVPNRGLHLDFWGVAVVEIGRNLGYTKWDKKTTPNWTLYYSSLADRYIQRLKSNYSPRNWGTLLMGCARPSGAPDISRRRPKTTHEVFSWTRSCEQVAQKPPQSRKKKLCFRRKSLVLIARWLHHRWQHGFHQKLAVVQEDVLNYFRDAHPKNLWIRKLRSRER